MHSWRLGPSAEDIAEETEEVVPDMAPATARNPAEVRNGSQSVLMWVEGRIW